MAFLLRKVVNVKILSLDVNAKAFFARRSFFQLLNMSPKAPLQVVQEQAKTIRQTLEELKSKLRVMNQEYNKVYAQYLRDEQIKLQSAVEEARNRLIQLEVQNGVQQIPIPNRNSVSLSSSSIETPAQLQESPKEKVQKPAKEKLEKPKKEKKAKETKSKIPAESELPVDVGRLDLRIAKIQWVQMHPDADTLFVLKINCGEEKPRTVCSGLVKYIPMKELENSFVVLLCNLKPVKMRGIISEAMVMCASTSDAVEVLIPPAGCEPGDLVYCEGYTRRPDDVMNPKKKIFETVAPDLHTNDNLEACYKAARFNVPGKGNIVAKTLKNVPIK